MIDQKNISIFSRFMLVKLNKAQNTFTFKCINNRNDLPVSVQQQKNLDIQCSNNNNNYYISFFIILLQYIMPTLSRKQMTITFNLCKPVKSIYENKI